MKKYLAGYLACSLAVLSISGDTLAASYKVEHSWPIGGPGGWNRLSLDARHERLYVTRGERVSVIDATSGREVGSIEGFKNAHAVALSADGKYGYATDGMAGTVHIFEQATLRPITELPAGQNPNALVFDTATRMAVVLSEDSNNATFIDEASNTVVGAVALPDAPQSVTTDGLGVAFISLNRSNAVARLNIRMRQVTATWSTETCEGPETLAVNSDLQRLYVACDNDQISAFDLKDGKLRGSTAVETDSRDLAIDKERKLLFAASGGGTLSVIHTEAEDKLTVVQVVPTKAGARTMALDALNDRVYLPTADFGQMTGVSEELRFRPTMVANSFRIVVVGNARP